MSIVKLEGLYKPEAAGNTNVEFALTSLPLDMSEDDLLFRISNEKPKYMVLCEWSHDVWFVEDDEELDEKFIYRDDLTVMEISSEIISECIPPHYEILLAYKKMVEASPRSSYKKACYILDCPPAEQYEVYDDSRYVLDVYGIPIPKGMSVYKFHNRFERDRKILELEKRYRGKCATCASKQGWQQLGTKSAIIVSDGGYREGLCSSTYYYIDKYSLEKESIAFVPSMERYGTLIAELRAVTLALYKCKEKRRTNIKCYYDNANIINIFNSNTLDDVREIAKYKNFVNYLRTELGISIEFIEVHPKTGNVTDYNRAITHFHNLCDKECNEMVELRMRPYVNVAVK